jgi:Tfp pilus assembly protein PilX
MLVMFATFPRKAPAPRSEDGFMLLEVVVSALLVGLIAIGTLSGIDASSRTTADQRAHNQATVIAQQDEDRLRGLPYSQLARVGSSTQTVAENGFCVEQVAGAWRYDTKTALEKASSCEASATAYEYAGLSYSATVFTVTSSASFYSASEKEFTCKAQTATADYIQTTSSVRWPALVKERPAVSQSSLVAVPTNASLLVKVKNANNEPVTGASVMPYSEKGSVLGSQTTPSSGCVIFGDLEEGNVTVKVSNGNWIGRNGLTEAEKTVKITGTSLAEAELTLEAPGSILAEFKNGSQPVSSFTATAYNAESTATSTPIGGNANVVATTAEITGLFPFVTPGTPPKENRYAVYAGDCAANKPSTVTSEVSEKEVPTAQVKPNEVTSVAVEAPEAKVTVYGEGTTGTKDPLTSTSATLSTVGCSAPSHKVQFTNGALEQKYLPYAKELKLCVVGKVGTKYYKNSSLSFANAKKSGTSTTLYLQSAGVESSTSTLSC